MPWVSHLNSISNKMALRPNKPEGIAVKLWETNEKWTSAWSWSHAHACDKQFSSLGSSSINSLEYSPVHCCPLKTNEFCAKLNCLNYLAKAKNSSYGVIIGLKKSFESKRVFSWQATMTNISYERWDDRITDRPLPINSKLANLASLIFPTTIT